VLTGEDEADNHEINVDRGIKGSCESSSLSHLSALGCTALIWFQRDFIIKKYILNLRMPAYGPRSSFSSSYQKLSKAKGSTTTCAAIA
jgi:hypothetical protein